MRLGLIGICGLTMNFGCGGPALFRAYEGPEKPVGEIATVTESDGVDVRSLNGKSVPYYSTTFEMAPGRHHATISIDIYAENKRFSTMGDVPIAFSVQAGKDYSFLTATVDERALVKVIDNAEPRRSPIRSVLASVSTPVICKEKHRGAQVGKGTATVSGVAYTEQDSWYITAADKEIHLVPNTPESRRWIAELAKEIPANPLLQPVLPLVFAGKLIAESEPSVVKPRRITILGAEFGAFTFQNVPDGDYIVFFRNSNDTVASVECSIRNGTSVSNLVLKQVGGE